MKSIAPPNVKFLVAIASVKGLFLLEINGIFYGIFSWGSDWDNGISLRRVYDCPSV